MQNINNQILTNHSELCKQQSKKAYYYNSKQRLLDSLGKLPDIELKEIASGIELLHKRDQLTLIGISEAVFRSKKTTFSQNYVFAITGICQSSLSKSLNRMTRESNNLFAGNRKLSSHAKVLTIRHNGFKVLERETYKTNKITQNMSSYIFTKEFIENLPYLAKLSPVCGKIFAAFRKAALITHLKRGVLNNLGTKQFYSFKRFSVAALCWANDRLKEKLVKHIRIIDKERFLWSVCYRYDREYRMLRE